MRKPSPRVLYVAGALLSLSGCKALLPPDKAILQDQITDLKVETKKLVRALEIEKNKRKSKDISLERTQSSDRTLLEKRTNVAAVRKDVIALGKEQAEFRRTWETTQTKKIQAHERSLRDSHNDLKDGIKAITLNKAKVDGIATQQKKLDDVIKTQGENYSNTTTTLRERGYLRARQQDLNDVLLAPYQTAIRKYVLSETRRITQGKLTDTEKGPGEVTTNKKMIALTLLRTRVATLRKYRDDLRDSIYDHWENNPRTTHDEDAFKTLSRRIRAFMHSEKPLAEQLTGLIPPILAYKKATENYVKEITKEPEPKKPGDDK